MAICHFIGDEVTALGFRLAGAEVHTPPVEQVLERFRELCGKPGLLILTATAAEAVPDELLQAAIIAAQPLILLIPAAAGGPPAPDFAAKVRRQLGMSE